MRLTPARSLERDGYRVQSLHLGSHSGTHLDAPAHVLADGVGVDELPMHLLVGPAVVVDVRDLGAREPVRWERLAAYARPGRMLVLHTGWDRFWGSVRYDEHPYLDAEAASALVAAGVRTVGIDAMSIDGSGGEGLPAHEALLRAGGVVVENLTNLAALDHPEPVLSVLPLPLRGGDGSPVRAVALLPAEDSEAFLSALEPLARRGTVRDDRTAGQRRADALVEVCEQVVVRPPGRGRAQRTAPNR